MKEKASPKEKGENEGNNRQNKMNVKEKRKK